MGRKDSGMREIVTFLGGRCESIGTRVRYYPVYGQPDFVECATRSEPWVLGDGTAVVQLENRPGCFALRNIKKV